MDFARIPLILKRYDFDSKMEVCMNFSREITGINGLIGIEKLINKFLPWELEVFALFSLIADNEYANNSFNDKKGKKAFKKIMELIRNYQHPKLVEAVENHCFADLFMIASGLTQFQLQDNIYYKYYRQRYFFNFVNKNVNMQSEFVDKFGVNVEAFLEFGFIMNLIFCMPEAFDKNILAYTLNKYKEITMQLAISRDEFINKQSKVVNDVNNYIYCFKFFYQFPFILYNEKFYVPLPHLIIQSVTSSLLFRVTEGNNKLRELFGKEVMESYIIDICNLDENVDEIKKEYEYSTGKRTLDVMLRYQDYFVLMDSKAFTPRVDLRELNLEAIEYSTQRIVDSVIQVHKHVTKKFKVDYNPFKYGGDIRADKIFGLVIVAEDNFVRREKVYLEAAKQLNINNNSVEYNYLCSNIKILSLYNLEQLIFGSMNIVNILSRNRDDKSCWFNYSIADGKIDFVKLNDEIKRCESTIKKIYTNYANELVNVGLIKSNG